MIDFNFIILQYLSTYSLSLQDEIGLNKKILTAKSKEVGFGTIIKLSMAAWRLFLCR